MAGFPGGWARPDILTQYMYARFLGQLFFKFSLKKIAMGRKDRCTVFACNNERLFTRSIKWSSHFARKARINTEQLPPGHPIILLKSNEFNMAAVWVERSIENFDYREIAYPRGVLLFKSDGGVRRNISRTPPKRYQKLVSWACRTANWINFCLCCRLSSRPEIEANLVPMAFA